MMALRRLSLAPFRLRLLFRGAFLMLALATVALAVYVLREEQQLSYRNYEYGFGKSVAEIAARLRHPAGLALLNPPSTAGITPLHPLLLPFSALDFDDPNKVQQAVEMAGCTVQYPGGDGICTAIGNSPWAGGYIYVAGHFESGELVEHQRGQRELTTAHRLRVSVNLRGQHYAWTAPFERMGASEAGLRGRLTGFADGTQGMPATRPVKDFRGWLWQAPDCIDVPAPDSPCLRRSFFSVRLPVEVLRDALFDPQRPQWPPPDLDHIDIHVSLLPPGVEATPLLDSDAPGAVAPFSLRDLQPLLLPGEMLQVRKLDTPGGAELVRLVGTADSVQYSSRWIDRLLRRLMSAGDSVPIERRETITTPLGRYELQLTGDVRSVNKALAAVATRASWFVGAMLTAILLAWLSIEISIIRRINELRRRATSVARSFNATQGLGDFDLSDLRGPDELGVLAACLADLMRRVQEDVEREQIRAEQEKDLWHAVGHEIMSPLQSLMVLHGDEASPSHRYISRMQQAVRVLYGSASPSEAFQATSLQLGLLDLEQFLMVVAGNAPCVGIEDVHFTGVGHSVAVRADEHSLEDVVTHILHNAERYRTAGTPIHMTLEATELTATVTIHNQGPAIPAALIGRIFEYGVSDLSRSDDHGHRGQGLFVAKTYMAKMAGTISAFNTADGVSFVLGLPCVTSRDGSEFGTGA